MNIEHRFLGARAVVTGGTDGVGAATALGLRRAGADVTIIGRSSVKADALLARSDALAGPGSLHAVVADLSEMTTVEEVVDGLAATSASVDLLVHAVGVLLPYTAHTSEGIELDFAVGYLSRFVFLEAAAERGLLARSTRLVNIAASGARVPRIARVEFSDLAEVESRVGMRSHGQAQLANDLLTAQAPHRYGITAVGYGPGSVRTNIRRELPAALRVALAPIFRLSTRSPEQVAAQLLAILGDPTLSAGEAHFFDKSGPFPPSAYVTDPDRQRALLEVSTALRAKALARHGHRQP